jgi:DNA-binding NarL/FixJ family response regulator
MAKRLLVVDDEPNLLRAVSMTLRAEGYEVVTARSGAEAIVRLAESVPDLIISDIRMPGMDGHTLARYLRGNARTNLIPIIFLTAKDTAADRIAGFRSGVDAYITKPFEPEELTVILSSILERVQRTHAVIARGIDLSALKESGNVGGSTRDEDLTEAEDRVARSVARGLSNKEIALELRISVRTVETHIRHILTKKHWSNRVEIARHVIKREQSN